MQIVYKALVFAALGRAASAAQASIQQTGRTLTLSGIPYFVPPSPVSALHDALALATAAQSASDGLVPFSVIPTSKQNFDEVALNDTVAAWLSKDDVWSMDFLTGLFFSVTCDLC